MRGWWPQGRLGCLGPLGAGSKVASLHPRGGEPSLLCDWALRPHAAAVHQPSAQPAPGTAPGTSGKGLPQSQPWCSRPRCPSQPLPSPPPAPPPPPQALGKRLGKDMGKVGAAIKGLGAQQLAGYEASGSITVEGHELGPGDIKVRA